MRLHEHKELNEVFHMPCPSCGGQIAYSAEAKTLLCPYCNHQEELEQASDKVVEKSLHNAVAEAGSFSPEAIGKRVFHCNNCGSNVMVEHNKVRINCGFCGSENVNEEAFNHNYISPVGVLPFSIPAREAEVAFKRWIKEGWFHPNKLKKLASLENLHGIYIPFWTYDAQTNNQYQGEAGYHKTRTRMINVNGKMVAQTYVVTEWFWRNGSFQHFFDDVLVVASHGLSQKRLQGVYPFRLDEVLNFDARYLLGWEAEVYDMEVDAGYSVANKIMDERLLSMAKGKIGGQAQRNVRVNSRKHSQTFKHILLPIWLCSYEYRGKRFQFAINGQTGKVSGEKPLSWIKITLAFLVAALILFGLYIARNGF